MPENNRQQKIFKIKDGLKNSQTEGGEKVDEKFEKDFYLDLDKIRRKNCCSLPIITIFLIIVFIAIIYGLLYIKNYAKTGISYVASSHNPNQKDLAASFIDKTGTLPSGETATLDFSDIELSQYLGIADSDFPLKNAKLSIDEQGIRLSGKTSQSIFSLPVKCVLKPKIEDNKLLFILDEIATGSISLPGRIKGDVNAYLDLIMRSKGLYDPNLEIISAATLDNILRLEVHKK